MGGEGEHDGSGVVALDYQDIEDLGTILPQIPLGVVHLDLHGNRLSTLPDDLSAFASLRTLNVEQNPFASVEGVLPGLRSLPCLEELNINMNTEDEEVKLIVGLPGLKYLNGTALGDDADGEKAQPPPDYAKRKPFKLASSSDVALTQEDLKSVASMYGSILSLQEKKADDARYLRNFDGHVQNVMRGLSVALEGLEDPYLRQGEILRAKHKLYDVCFKELVEHAEASSPQFGKVLKMLHEVHENLFGKFPAVIHEMRPFYVEKLAKMHSEVVRAERETNMLLEAAEVLEKEAVAHADEKRNLRRAINDAASGHDAEMSALRAENERMKLELQRYAGDAVGRGTISKKSVAPRRAAAANGKAALGSALAPSSAPHAAGAAKKKPVVIRNLTLKQLHDYIEQIYASKVKFDEKCADAHLPRETMEQHMYTFLNQRYGLKQLIVDHASAIIKAVNRFSQRDNDIAVFGKILRNEIDEEFRGVQHQLKETVAELLRVYLQSRHPLKTDHAINALLSARLGPNGSLQEAEWVEIVKYMYCHEDCLTLIVMVKDAARRQVAGSQMAQQHPHRAKGMPREQGNAALTTASPTDHTVRYKSFINILLNFQLKGHEKFLSQVSWQVPRL